MHYNTVIYLYLTTTINDVMKFILIKCENFKHNICEKIAKLNVHFLSEYILFFNNINVEGETLHAEICIREVDDIKYEYDCVEFSLPTNFTSTQCIDLIVNSLIPHLYELEINN